MANICSVCIKMIFESKSACRQVLSTLEERLKNAPAGYGTTFSESPDSIYFFDPSLEPEDDFTLRLTGWVRWALPIEFVKDFIQWLVEHEVKPTFLSASYDECGMMLYGVYEWDGLIDLLTEQFLDDAAYSETVEACTHDGEIDYDELDDRLIELLNENATFVTHGNVLEGAIAC